MKNRGFTIVELLVVIVVIGILAAITIVSYSGISAKATVATLKSDLDNAKKQLALYNVDHSAYPTSPLTVTGSNYCPSDDTKYCFKASGTNTFTYTPVTYYPVGSTPQAYSLTSTTGSTVYSVTNTSTPAVTSSLAITDPSTWLTIGTQVWAKYNLNVGTRIAGNTAQTNNSILEKYCYANTESNCTSDGGLYQWNEAMQYVTTEAAQGICPTGSHIPSDNDWKILEMQLGMKQESFDDTGWHSLDQATTATQFKAGGSTGLNLPLSGYNYNYSFYDRGTYGNYWASSESSTSAWTRYININYVYDGRSADPKTIGYSVRCLGN